MSEALPEFVEERIQQILTKTSIEREVVLGDYNKIFNDPYILADETLDTERKHRLAIMMLWKDYVARPPANYLEE